MSWLSSIGHVFKEIFTNPVAIRLEATVADIALPEFSVLINSAASSIISSEAAAIAGGVQRGTGTQKMAYAVTLFENTYNQWAAKNNIAQEPAAVKNILQNVFQLLNTLKVVDGGAAAASVSAVNQPVVAVPVEAPAQPLVSSAL